MMMMLSHLVSQVHAKRRVLEDLFDERRVAYPRGDVQGGITVVVLHVEIKQAELFFRENGQMHRGVISHQSSVVQESVAGLRAMSRPE